MKYLTLLLIAVSVIACHMKEEEDLKKWSACPECSCLNTKQPTLKNVLIVDGVAYDLSEAFMDASFKFSDSIVRFECRPTEIRRHIEYYPRFEKIDTIKTY